MRLRFSAAAAVIALVSGPAFAHDGHPPRQYDPAPAYPGGPYRSDDYHEQYGRQNPDQAREAWLADCRQRVSSRDSGIGGAVIGGVVGGVAGNRIAGRGNRTVGTIAGAAVGAAAGAIIDKAEDSGRNRDECEAYLDDYYANYPGNGGRREYGYGHSYGGQAQPYYPAYGAGYGYGYAYPAQGCCMAPQMMMVPVMRAEPQCTETVEYVYEDVPVRAAPKQRYMPKRTKIVPDKRVKITPDKRIKTK